jgi:predicted nucleic acid-binding protein
LLENFILSQISLHTIQRAFLLCERYEYSYWDSLLLSSALENNCTTIYSEDMQNGQVIENTLTVVNPFANEDLPDSTGDDLSF